MTEEQKWKDNFKKSIVDNPAKRPDLLSFVVGFLYAVRTAIMQDGDYDAADMRFTYAVQFLTDAEKDELFQLTGCRRV